MKKKINANNPEDFLDPAKTAWDMFEKTGNISYYLLYKNLTEL